MVKITNGVDVFEVTRGAFDGIYSRQGYTVIDENKPVVEEPQDVNTGDTKTEDEIFIEEILEEPVSKWNKDEVKRFAAIKGIDISGTKNAGEAKELIKNFLDQE